MRIKYYNDAASGGKDVLGAGLGQPGSYLRLAPNPPRAGVTDRQSVLYTLSCPIAFAAVSSSHDSDLG